MAGINHSGQRPLRGRRANDTQEHTGSEEKRTEFVSKKARIAMRRLKKRGGR